MIRDQFLTAAAIAMIIGIVVWFRYYLIVACLNVVKVFFTMQPALLTAWFLFRGLLIHTGYLYYETDDDHELWNCKPFPEGWPMHSVLDWGCVPFEGAGQSLYLVSLENLVPFSYELHSLV